MRHTNAKTWFLILAGFLVLGGRAWLAGQEAPRSAIPSKVAQARARALILEIFKEDLAAARDAASKSKLAANLLQQGKDSKDDLANRYMLYVEARELAARAGDAPLALSAIEELARSFEGPVLEMKAAVLATVAAHMETKEAGKLLVDLALPLIAEAVDADDYETALKLGQVAELAAKKAKSVPLVQTVLKRNEEVRAVQKGFDRLKAFVDRLKKNPKDPEANLEMGKYFALLKGKWDRALPLLAKGGDEALKDQAVRDLAKPGKGKEQLEVADGWWQLALKEKDPARLNLENRARFWYEKAVLDLAGLNRTKALRRIDQINARREGVPASLPLGPVGEIRKFEGHTDEIKSVAFSPDGRFAVSGGLDNTVRVWNLANGKEEQALRGHSNQIWAVVYHPNGRQVLSSSWDKTVRLWDVKSGMEVKRFPHPIDVNGLAVSRDGSKFLAGCDNKHAYLWNLNTGEELRRYNGFDNYVYSVAFAPDGKHVACGSADRSIRVYDLVTGQQQRVMEQGDAVMGLTYSPDSRYLFSCGDGLAHQWDVASGKEIRRFEGHKGRVLGLALSHDGRRLITGGDDQTVRLWDAGSGKQLKAFQGHTSAVNAVAVSFDGHRALSAGLDRTVRLWGLPGR